MPVPVRETGPVTTTPVNDELTEQVRADLDAAVADLGAGIRRWAALSLRERAALLERTHASIHAHSADWARAAITAKGTPAAAAGEEWLSGPYSALGGFATVGHSLRALAEGRSPAAGLKEGTAPGGRTTLQVLPTSTWDRLLLHGFSAQVWMPPGVTGDQARLEAGLGARRIGEAGGVGLVLGAGNISSIGPLDCLYELVAFNRASVLKLNPTFAGLEGAYTRALAPLIEADLLRIVNGAAAIGGHLAHHPDIVHVHITGAGVTHDAIVWGTGAEATERRAAGRPVLDKPISSELGGVAPIIVVPGRWSKADLRYQAEHVATMRLQNSGHNCIAGQALVLSRDWPQRTAFLDQLRQVLDELPARTPWYPGTDRKLAAARASYPAAEDHHGRLLVEVSEQTSTDLLVTEYFGPVLGHTSIPGTGAAFLRAAVAFANDRLDGTLGANVLVRPRDRRAIGAAFDEAIADLRAGTIAINAWTGLGFTLPGAPWGAFPGNTIADVGSGIGVVHNGFLIDGPERTVVTGPFRPAPRSLTRGELAISPKPPWFTTARTGAETSRLLTGFVGEPRWKRLPAIFRSALRG